MDRTEWEEWLRRWERRQEEKETVLLHRDILTLKTEEELRALKRRFAIAEETSKEEAIATITTILKEVHGKCNILTVLNMDELRGFVQLIRNGEVAFRELSDVFASELLELGIVQLEERKQGCYAILPDDLQECWGKAELNADFPQGVLLHQMTLAIRGMVQLYGFVWMDVITERMLEYFPGQITNSGIRQIAQRLGNAKKIGYTPDYVYDLKIEDPETYCRFYEDLPYKEIDLDTILLYAEPHYMEHGQASMPLKMALSQQEGIGNKVEEVLSDIYQTTFTLPTSHALQHRLQVWGIEPHTLSKELHPLIEQYQQSIMIQRYRGHTHKELEALLGADAYDELLFWEGQGISSQTLDAWQQAKENVFAFEEDQDDWVE
ncbi:MAG: hypothetical protein ACRDBX_03455 [Erysipelotrichaceae bacterium]